MIFLMWNTFEAACVVYVYFAVVILQIKVWFQNRRTKHKRDQTLGLTTAARVPTSQSVVNAADAFYHHRLHPGLPPSFPVTCSSTGSRESRLNVESLSRVRSAGQLQLENKFPFGSVFTSAAGSNNCDALPPGAALPTYCSMYSQFQLRDSWFQWLQITSNQWAVKVSWLK